MYSSSYKLYQSSEVCSDEAPDIPALQYDNYCAGECNINDGKRVPALKEVRGIETEISPTPLFIHKIKTDTDGRADFLMQVLDNPQDYVLRISAYTDNLQTCSIQQDMGNYI